MAKKAAFHRFTIKKSILCLIIVKSIIFAAGNATFALVLKKFEGTNVPSFIEKTRL
jgi:hypothetical protein